MTWKWHFLSFFINIWKWHYFDFLFFLGNYCIILSVLLKMSIE